MLVPPGYIYYEPSVSGRLKGIGVGVSKNEHLWLPLPIFVVEHPTAGLILIDTGPPTAAAHDPRAAFGRFGAMVYNVRMRPEQAAAAQLRGLGIDPADVRTVILTHMHFTSSGAAAEFSDAMFIVSKVEWQAMQKRNGFKAGYIPRLFEHGLDYRLVDYDAPSVNSFASFARSIDLFGDGSITLVSTPGHAAGHQSVVLRLSDREALICGDAAHTRKSIDEGFRPLALHDEHNYKRSLREIRSYTQMTPSAIVIPGHDAEVWARLEDIYD
jgi:glyoxylase-like metal-dependent hydrolase (beta-lactamase superfamily II)